FFLVLARAFTADEGIMKLFPAAMDSSNRKLKIPGVSIRDVECTRKTYPNFFEDLARLRWLQ
ncbi:MAG TPA: hypothetical protein VG722_06110, partial [Tepidisphaeraceae bacterium]|nr:hypothetical protein [Tepidisphaeraceae bacterium]